MLTVTCSAAKIRFKQLLDRVSKGEQIVIVRGDRPIARIVPEPAQRPDEVREAVAGLRALQRRIRRRSKIKVSTRQVRRAIERGRS